MTAVLLALGTLAGVALLGLFLWSLVDRRNRRARPAAADSGGWKPPVVHLGRVQPAQRGYLAVCTAASCSWARQLDTAAEADRVAFDHTLQLDAGELVKVPPSGPAWWDMPARGIGFVNIEHQAQRIKASWKTQLRHNMDAEAQRIVAEAGQHQRTSPFIRVTPDA
jgi:hypothetical protein